MEKDERPLKRSPPSRRRPPTSNYYRSGANGAAMGISPFRKKNKSTSGARKLLGRALDLILIGAILIGLGYSLIVNPTARVEVNNTFYHSIENYRDAAHRHLMAFKDRNKISFDENAVVSDLMLDYPEIDNASIELPVFSQRPVVRIVIAAPSFVLSSNQHDYVIDANGKAIGLTSNFKKASSLPKIMDQSNYPVVAGKAVLSSSDVAFIRSLLKESGKSKVGFDALLLPTAAGELDAKPTNKPYIVKFYLGGDAPLQIGQFLAASHQFDSSGQQPTQYLDVRVSGKIFYK